MKTIIKVGSPILTKSIITKIRKLYNNKVQVGYLFDDKYQSDRNTKGLTIPQLAYLHEYGNDSTNLPSRPFMSQSVGDARTVKAQLRKVAPSLLSNPQDSLNNLGTALKEEVRKTIDAATGFQELSPITIAKKGGDSRILIETGQMRDAVRHEVRSNHTDY